MKSENYNSSDEGLKKATELLQKVWWFLFLLVIAPLAVSFAGFWIFVYIPGGIFIQSSLTIITYMFALLFFYKAFDKYRKKPFFLNKENNLTARVHIIFLISILSFIGAPIFTLLSKNSVSFALLPFISFAVLYNIVYYYYSFQPVDLYNETEQELKHGINLESIIKQPNNFVIGINYVSHIIFLYITHLTDLYWFFPLITNLILYFITYANAAKYSKRIKESIGENKPFLNDLTQYKRSFVISITSLIFILFIQLPFVFMAFSGKQFSWLEVLNGSFLSVIFILFFVKTVFYINYHYSIAFDRIKDIQKNEEPEEPEEKISLVGVKYQKYSAFSSGVLIGLITFFCFSINSPWLILTILPFIFIFSYLEQKANICPKRYNKYILLLNSAVILAAISFGLLAEVFLNIQFIIFLLSSYFILQIFVRTDYFKKENIIVIQNILAIASFTLIIYSFFGYTSFNNIIIFEFALFAPDSLTILISNFLIHGILISIISLISSYILYSRFLYSKRSKSFRISLFGHILLLELFIYILIALRTAFMIQGAILFRVLVISSLLFPIITILFVFINYLLGVFSQKHFITLCYYLFWALICDLFLSVLLISLNSFVILTLDFLFLSFFSQFILKFGFKLEKVKESTFNRFVKINSYFKIIELYVMCFSLFFSFAFVNLMIYDNITLSSYFTLLIITLSINVLSKLGHIFSDSIAIRMNLISLFFSAGLACYYSIVYTLNSFYVFLIPFLSFFAILYIPLYYLFKKKIYEEMAYRGMMIDCVLLAILVTLLPTIGGLQLYLLELPIDFLLLIDFTLLLFPIICLILVFMNYILQVYSQKNSLIVSYYLFWVLIVDIFLAIFLLNLNNYIILSLDFLFLSIFSQLNLKFGLKLEKVRDSITKRYFKINSYIITIELFSLFFFFFYSIVFPFFKSIVLVNIAIYLSIAFSAYFSLLIMTVLVNLLSKNEILFSKSIAIKINLGALLYSAGLAFYYSFLFTLYTFSEKTYFVFLIPFLWLFAILFLPIIYMLKRRISEKIDHYFRVRGSVINRVLIINYILFTFFITLIPTVVSLELYRIDFLTDIDIVSVINYTLFILFGIITITYYLLKKFKKKEKYKTGIIKSQILIEVLLTVTTAFYYIFILLYVALNELLFPLIAALIAASCFFYVPSIISYKKKYFNENIVKKFILGNSILLSGLVILIPSIFGLELMQLGLTIDWILIFAISLVIFFGDLRFLRHITKSYNLLEKRIKFLKLMEVFTWFLISILTALYIFSNFLVDLSLSSALLIFFVLNLYTSKLLYEYAKEWRFNVYLREIVFYGIIFSFAFLIISSIQFSNVLNLLPQELYSLNILLNLGFLFLLALLLIRYISSLVKIEFIKIKNGIEVFSWIIFKITFCLFISIGFSNSILRIIVIYLLLFAFLSPVTLSYFRSLTIFSEEIQLILKKIILGLFIVSILVLYSEFFYNNTVNISFFNNYRIFQIPFIFSNLFVYLYFCLLRYNSALENDSSMYLYRFYLSSFILFLSLLYIDPILSIVLILFPLILILSRRSFFLVLRFLSYLLLSYIMFVDIIIIGNRFKPLIAFNLNLLGFFVCIYLLSLTTVLLFSVWLNYRRNNNLEKFSLYTAISSLSFVFLYSYTPILILYNITIPLFIFLFLIAIYFYRHNNEIYKWFIKPCVLLLIFDFVSLISYSFLFIQPTFKSFNPILTLTLSLSITGFSFIFLYNKAPVRFRKTSFYFVLIAIVFSFPIFLYFFIISSFSIPFSDPIPVITAINVGVFLFYLSLGIYQWRISWTIWKSGWYAWMILPFANFLIIYQNLRGIDPLKNSLNFFGIPITGSSIFAIIICSLFFLPVLYTKIKKHFFKIIFLVWGESLFLLYWISHNLFVNNSFLGNLSFVLFAFILLMPLLIKLKFWTIVSVFWLILTGINISFLYFYLDFIEIPFEISISINVLVIGLLLIVYSFFPKIRSVGIILITSYVIFITGIFLTIYFILNLIGLDPIFSINFSLIAIGFSLFSSKPLKLSLKIFDQFLSWILIINFSWLTYNTFNLLPRIGITPFFLSVTVFGGLFYIFNQYKMRFRINKANSFLIMVIGASSSITSLTSILLNPTPLILISIFSGSFIVFYYFFLTEYRYILWFLIPIPIALSILNSIILFEIIKTLWFLAFSLIYLTSFQILINIFKNIGREVPQERRNSILMLFDDKNQLKKFNLTCFLLNSIILSIFISYIIPLLIDQFLFSHLITVYQILNFLIICPLFILFSLKYIEKSKIDLKIKNLLLYFNKLSFGIYLLISIALAFNILLFVVYISFDLITVVFIFLLTVSGVIFFESFIIDRRILYYLINSTRDKFIFWSYLAFSNTISIFFYSIHLNIFFLVFSLSLLNLISLYFLSYLNISEQKIFTMRLILVYNLFIWGSFYLGSLISDGLTLIFKDLRGIPYFTLLFQNSFLILYILSYFLVKVDKKLKSSIEIILFTLFQGFLAINWVYIFTLFDVLNFFMIDLLLLIETCLFFRTFKYLNTISFEVKYPKFLTQSFSLLALLFYFETSLLIYFLLIELIGVFESILVSQLVFFVFTLLDIYLIRKIEKGYAQLIHTASFFVISLMTLFTLNQYVVVYQMLLSLEIFIFALMQFYTNHSFFTALNQFNQDKVEIKIIYKVETLNKLKDSFIHILGTWFYLNISFILLQALTLLNVDPQLIILSLSIIIHILMIIDTNFMKFLGKYAKYIKVISWASTMISTTTFIIVIFYTYFIGYLNTTIPLILFLLTIETVYLFKLLEFWQFVISNKQRIRLILIYNLFIWGSFYLGSIISNGIMILFNQLRGIPYIFLLFQNFTLLLFVLSYFLVKIDKKLKSSIEIILFALFQGFFAINWITIFLVFKVLNLFPIVLIVLFETIFFFGTAKYLNIISFEAKYPKFLSQIFSVLTLLLYLETSLLMYGLMIEIVKLRVFESILVSQLILFGFTLLEMYSVKKIKRKFAQLIHTVSYFVVSLMIFLILNQYIVQNPILLSLGVLFFILMQFYTNYSLFSLLNQYSREKIEVLNKLRSHVKNIIGIGFYINLSLVLFQALTLLNVGPLLILFSLSIMVHILMIIDTYILKFVGKVSIHLSLLSWILLMASMAMYLIYIFSLFDLINYFTIALLILIETCLTFRAVKYLNQLFFKEKHPTFLVKASSSIVISLYFEISLLIYGLMIEIVKLRVFESILVSQLIFFTFTLLDIYVLKKIKDNYAQLIHTISYFIISLMVFIILSPIMLSLSLFLFILMQFYTNYSLFTTLNQFNPNKIEYYKKKKLLIIQVIGICFYVNLLFLLTQTLIFFNTGLQLLLLTLSLMAHFLMIADEYLLKFMKNLSKYFKVSSWIFFMIFTTTYLIRLYVIYFIDYLLTSIPLIVLLLILETVYLFKQLVIWEFVISNKMRIRSYLILTLYLNFGTWPFYYITFTLLPVLNLLLLTLSLIIFFILTYVDKFVGALKEKSLATLSKTLFLIIGILLSIDVYLLLDFVPNANIFFKLNISFLIFVVFSGIIVKPFKKHSFIAFFYWAAIFSLLSSLILVLSSDPILSGGLLFITILIYPFIFLLEELRELFNKFIDALIKFFRLIKQSIINSFKILFRFLRTHYRFMWKLFSAFIAILSGILLSELVFSFLNWYHSILLVLALFGFLYLILPAEDSTDADVIFKRRILRLSLGWGSLIGILFIMITIEWYIFTIFISIAVVGTIVLVYLSRKEEREKISIKWRFYTLLSLFLLLIISGVMLTIQLITITL